MREHAALRPAGTFNWQDETIYYRGFILLVSNRGARRVVDHLDDRPRRVGDEYRATHLQRATQVAICLISIRQMCKTETARHIVKHHEAKDLVGRRAFRDENRALRGALRCCCLAQCVVSHDRSYFPRT